MAEDSGVHAFSGATPLLSILWHCDPKKETDRCFFIDPSADFGFADRVQSPDLVLDPFDIDGHAYIYHT
jgi:hypothetical protein